MPLELSDETRKQAVASIRRYFADELDQEIGDLKAQLLLEFFLKEIGPTIYNGAINDAQGFVRDRLADLGDVTFQKEFAFWQPATSAKRKRS